MILRDCLSALPGQDRLLRRSIRVRGERIAEISESIAPEAGEEIVEAGDLVALPGAIDPHVHFDEPGFTHREDFLHGSAEAAKGGVTTVIDMPCTSLPPVTTSRALDGKLASIRGKALVDYALFGGVSGHTVEASLGPEGMAELASRVVGFKCYFISGMDSFTRVTHDDFARVVAEGERLGRPILLHAEDLDYVAPATARIKAARGEAPARWSDYADSRPEAAELAAVAAALALSRGREASLHIVHVGTSAAADLVAAAGASCETCAHYLAFGREDFESLGAALKTAPVVKSRSERALLWDRLASGAISFLASDHAPAPEAEKNTGDPWTAYGGIPGTGTMLPFAYSEGFVARRLPLRRFVDAIAGAAARRYGLDARKGSLEAGKDADIVLIDPSASTIIEGSRLLSKGRITPFEGMRLSGRIVTTFLRGRPVYASPDSGFRASDPSARGLGLPGIIAQPGCGRFLTWGYH